MAGGVHAHLSPFHARFPFLFDFFLPSPRAVSSPRRSVDCFSCSGSVGLSFLFCFLPGPSRPCLCASLVYPRLEAASIGAGGRRGLPSTVIRAGRFGRFLWEGDGLFLVFVFPEVIQATASAPVGYTDPD